MIKPTEEIYREMKANGNLGRTVRRFSYVVVLCDKGGSTVAARRFDYYRNKEEVHEAVRELYPELNIKSISRLYDADFTE